MNRSGVLLALAFASWRLRYFVFFHVGEHYTVVHYFPSVLLFVTLADPLETAE